MDHVFNKFINPLSCMSDKDNKELGIMLVTKKLGDNIVIELHRDVLKQSLKEIVTDSNDKIGHESKILWTELERFFPISWNQWKIRNPTWNNEIKCQKLMFSISKNNKENYAKCTEKTC